MIVIGPEDIVNFASVSIPCETPVGVIEQCVFRLTTRGGSYDLIWDSHRLEGNDSIFDAFDVETGEVVIIKRKFVL